MDGLLHNTNAPLALLSGPGFLLSLHGLEVDLVHVDGHAVVDPEEAEALGVVVEEGGHGPAALVALLVVQRLHVRIQVEDLLAEQLQLPDGEAGGEFLLERLFLDAPGRPGDDGHVDHLRAHGARAPRGGGRRSGPGGGGAVHQDPS